MRVLKLHHPTGHPYWSQGEYQIEMPSGEMIYPNKHLDMYITSYRLHWDDKGVWVIQCNCSSGGGKNDLNPEWYPTKLLVKRSEYDTIEFVGKELVMSDKLRQDLINNKII